MSGERGDGASLQRGLKQLWWHAIPRGVAGFFGAFAVLNSGGELLVPGFDANSWWLEPGHLGAVAPFAFGAIGVVFLAFAVRPPRSRWRRWATAFAAVVATGIAGGNALAFWRALDAGRVADASPVPISLWLALGFGAIVVVSTRAELSNRSSRAPWWLALGSAAAVGLSFAIGQLLLFGATDYRRPADAVVVFGARVYPDGTPSMALSDRVRTGADLVQSGYARTLLLSGGRDPGGQHETDAMVRIALEHGVPAERIVVDRAGSSTQATVDNTAPLARKLGDGRLLAVSHGYHLARIKLAYQRAGVEVLTVPADESRPMPKLPYFMARELVALVAYWARPLFDGAPDHVARAPLARVVPSA